MNCYQANNNISIREVLTSFSLLPSKENPRSSFYYAIDREERTPSLLVDYIKNIAFDFGTGKKYDNVSIVQAVQHCSVSEALQYLQRFDMMHEVKEISIPSQKAYKILSVGELTHPALLRYLGLRKVLEFKAEVSEIHYELNGKRYFAVGFKNNSDGFETRNLYSKICLGKKDITTVKIGSNCVRVFEGFMDYLSFKVLEKSINSASSDYIILNSVSMAHKASEIMKQYEEIELFLDNDRTGDHTTSSFKNEFPATKDRRILYPRVKDLNEFLAGTIKPEQNMRRGGR